MAPSARSRETTDGSQTSSVSTGEQRSRPVRAVGREARGPRRLKSLLYSQRLAPYLFIAPFVITLLAFWMVPLARTFQMSTQEVLFGEATFIGADNYQRLWNDRIFWKALFNSTRYMVLTIALLIPIPLVLAALHQLQDRQPTREGGVQGVDVRARADLDRGRRHHLPPDVLRDRTPA